MIQRVDEIHTQLQALPFFELEVLLYGQVERFDNRPPRSINRARGVSEFSFGRAHESGWIEVGLAGRADRTVAAPERVSQRRARNQVRTNRAEVAGGQLVAITDYDNQRRSLLNARRAAQ